MMCVIRYTSYIFVSSVYSPKPDYLVPMLRKLPMFHDASYPLLQKHNKKMSELPLVMPYVMLSRLSY